MLQLPNSLHKPLSLFLICFFLSLSHYVIAQNRYIEGVIESGGEPIPGITIRIEGTKKGTITNLDGEYYLKVNLGDIITFSTIGYSTKTIIITRKNSYPIAGTDRPNNYQLNTPIEIPSLPQNLSQSPQFIPKDKIIYKPDKQINGVGVLNSQTPTLKINSSNINYRGLVQLNNKRIIKAKKNAYKLKTIPSYKFTYSLGLTLDKLNLDQLPEQQTQFTQGSPLNGQAIWLGADSNEPFSWGADLSSQYFDGSEYKYDQYGRLSDIPTDRKAIHYSPLDIFQTGLQMKNSFSVWRKKGKHILYTVLHRTDKRGTLKDSGLESTALRVKGKLTNLLKKDLNIYYELHLQDYKATGVNKSGHHARLLYNLLNTPTTVNANDTNLLAHISDGQYFSSGYHHPNNLLAKNYTEGYQKLRADLGLKYYLRNLDINMFSTYQINQQKDEFAVLNDQSTQSAIAYRTDKLYRWNQKLFINYSNHIYLLGEYFDLNTSFTYDYDYNKRDFERQESDILTNKLTPIRYSHNSSLSVILNYRYRYSLSLTNSIYDSNTAQKTYWWLPFISIELNPLQYTNVKPYLSAEYRKEIKEVSIFNYNRQYTSTLYSVMDINRYTESEYFNPVNLVPEIHQKLDIRLGANYNRHKVEVTYFNHNQEQVTFAPNGETASIRNQGIEVLLNTYFKDFDIGLVFNHSRPIVTSVSTPSQSIVLTGFEEVNQQLIPKHPIAAIVGSTYQRNENGAMIIDDDGYPLVNDNKVVIGNPNPDFTIGWSNKYTFSKNTHGKIEYPYIQLELLYMHGGDKWNGTAAMMDYHGTSLKTAQQRNTSNYIFKGVDTDNLPNQIAVNFADPAQDVSSNRWVRYGSGVAEDYIEDASSLRIKRTGISLPVKFGFGKATFSFFVHNILLWKAYSGTDPYSSFLGYESGYGMDFFNAPSTTSYSFNLKVAFN